MTTELTSKAMLVSLQIKVPSTTKKDKQATLEVTASHHAKAEAARVNKDLYIKEAIEGFSRAAREARSDFYDNTLQWRSPQRILLSDNYEKLSQLLEKSEERFWKEAEKFIANHDDQITEARKMLGSLFREEDYLGTDELSDKFSFDVAFVPLSDEEDWRVDLGGAEEQVKERIRRQLEASYQAAAREPWDRLKEVLDAMVLRLSDPDKRFASTLVSNISDLCEVLPGLNIGNDPKLDEMIAKVRSQVAERTPEELRKDKKVRKQTAEKALKLSKQVEKLADRAEKSALH